MAATLFESSGPLRYSCDKEYGYKLIVEVDQDLSDYYRSLIPKWFDVDPQKYPAHISVIRHEVPVNLEYWGAYEGEDVKFCYSPEVRRGKVYWWLNAFSCRLREIRRELGLPDHSEFSRPPDGRHCYHITVGNSKRFN